MIEVPFDVNDAAARKIFLSRTLMDTITGITGERQPQWGRMSAQNMVEHLFWTFEVSIGKVAVECVTPEKLLERLKRFLYVNVPMQHDFRNPALGEDPPELRFAGLAESESALRGALDEYFGYFANRPEAVEMHPVFGPLGAEEWERAHFKHCYHHLLQFGLIREPKPEHH